MVSGLTARGLDATLQLRAMGIDPAILREPDAKVPIANYAALLFR